MTGRQRLRLSGRLAVLSLLVGPMSAWSVVADPGTRADRKALYRYLVDKTLERQMGSPAKDRLLGLDFERDAARLKREFLKADTDAKLYRAILKLSNCRKDYHLKIQPIDGGLAVEETTLQAPVRFAPDFGAPGEPVLFVADVAEGFERFADRTPSTGDRLVSVNGVSLPDHLAMTDPYMRYSTRNRKLLAYAKFAAWKRSTFPAELYANGTVKYVMEDRGGERYVLELPYLDPEPLEWTEGGPRRFPGFEKVLDLHTYALYLPESGAPVVLLEWREFGKFMNGELRLLMQYAKSQGLLDHDVIIDATHSRGGTSSPELIRRVASRPFKLTFVNARISDVTVPLADYVRELYSKGHPVIRWFETVVAGAAAAGKEYSPSIPYGLRYPGAGEEGILEPAGLRFRGRLVCLFGPMWGSEVDQFASMIVDNGLAHTIGMPPAGHSNAFEYEEDVVFPTTGKPAVHFRWSLGQTLRPNGEVLEGNPAVPDEYVPLTRDGYATYFDDLVRRAMDHLDAGRREAERDPPASRDDDGDQRRAVPPGDAPGPDAS